MNSHQLINQTSSDVEYYTDPKIIAAAREVLGGIIDLDPASSSKANETVKACSYFGIDPAGMLVDGMFQKWFGHVWLNWPFGRKEKACGQWCPKAHKHHDIDFHGNSAWVKKLLSEFNDGNVKEALCICYACTSEAWFQPLMNYPQCFLSPRTNYYLPNGTLKKGVTKGSVVTYFGADWDKFSSAFSTFGKIKVAYEHNPHR